MSKLMIVTAAVSFQLVTEKGWKGNLENKMNGNPLRYDEVSLNGMLRAVRTKLGKQGYDFTFDRDTFVRKHLASTVAVLTAAVNRATTEISA